ncbi:MAG: hypothetical protein HQ596_04690 [Candidatus Saganbacteria bacterium]|nr:hypothetical protein [Candidatus Saganbacteria bacterium]
MAWSTVAIRPFNFLFRGNAFRAKSPHTSNWGVSQLLNGPKTRAAAKQNALHRRDTAHKSPSLCIAILTGNFDQAIKVQIISNISISKKMDIKTAFLVALSKQPQRVVEEIHGRWLQFNPSQVPTILDEMGRCVVDKTVEKGIAVFAQYTYYQGGLDCVSQGEILVAYRIHNLLFTLSGVEV